MSSPSRVYFRERQPLRASDLQAEQDYLLGLVGRHAVAAHEWGIVRGLAITLEGDVATVSPGLAVDGYGRELALFQPVQSPYSKDALPAYIYLYSCERPWGGCGEEPNTRFYDTAEIQISPEPWSVPEEDPPLTQARAAGKMSPLPSWPVLLGEIRLDTLGEIVDLSSAPYTRLRASGLLAPTRTAVMRVGQEHLADPYHFNVCVADAKGALQNRFAIDRDGNPIFWGDLILTSAAPAAALGTLFDSLALRAVVKPLASGDVHVKSELIRNSPKGLALKITFSGKVGTEGQIKTQSFLLDESIRDKELKERIKNFNHRFPLVRLSEIGYLPHGKIAAAKRAPAFVGSPRLTKVPLVDDRDQILTYDASNLIFAALPEEPRTESCGCAPTPDAAEALPEGFIFQPGTAPPAVASRDIYSLHLTPAKAPPSDEFRLAGGAFADGDYSRHISIGQRSSQAPYLPWLALRGNGSIAIPGDPYAKDTSADTLLEVHGSSQLPPVKPDPRDALYNSLLILAFTRGVLSLSQSTLRLTMVTYPPIEAGQGWKYDLTIANLNSSKTLILKSTSEILWMGTFASIGGIPNVRTSLPPGSQLVTVSHMATDVPNGVTQVAIEVSMAMMLDSAPTAGTCVSDPIPVVQSPSVVFSGLSDPISSSQEKFNIGVTNNAKFDLRVTAVRFTAPQGYSQPPVGVDVLVPAQTHVPVKTNLPPPPVLMPAVIQFTVEITYHWILMTGNSEDRTLTDSKTVTVDL